MRYAQIKHSIARLALVAVFVGAASNGICGQSRLTINLNPVWRFHLGPLPVDPTMADYDDSAWDVISLPHAGVSPHYLHFLTTSMHSPFGETDV